MNTIAAATASAKSWKKLAEGLEAEAAPFENIGAHAGELTEVLLYGLPMMNAGLAYVQASKAAARALRAEVNA